LNYPWNLIQVISEGLTVVAFCLFLKSGKSQCSCALLQQSTSSLTTFSCHLILLLLTPPLLCAIFYHFPTTFLLSPPLFTSFKFSILSHIWTKSETVTHKTYNKSKKYRGSLL
jgi:hypothetical protein